MNLPLNLPALTAAHLLLRNPPNIKEWWVALFLITLEIEMMWEEWQERWPYIMNFWSRQKNLKFDPETLTREDYYYC